MKERLLSLLGTAALIIAVAVVLPPTQVLGGGSGRGGTTGACLTDTQGGFTNCAGQGTCTGTCILDRSSTTGGCPCI